MAPDCWPPGCLDPPVLRVDLEAVWAIVRDDLHEFKQAVAEILAEMQDNLSISPE